ncbi:MAG TPA: hypothetical protein VIL78_00675 [Hanamia sp.]
MELPSLIKAVLTKTAPMTALENTRINDDCRLWYEQLVAKTVAKTKLEPVPTLTLVDKVVLQMDSWYCRLALALSYFIIIRFIQQLMNPGGGDDLDED